jgi:protein-S-isoprenylcysteine O-methyltransferase Ste14
MKTNLLTLAVFLFGLAFLVAHLRGQPWTHTRILGGVIFLPATALLILARLQLGRSFSVGAKAEALVTSGLYSKIQNPIYVFGALVIGGGSLLVGAPKLLWVLVVLIPLQIYRAKQEENVLAAKFGDQYRTYRARTWF